MIGRLLTWLRSRRTRQEPEGLSPEVERRQDNLLAYSDHTTRNFIDKVEKTNRLLEEYIRQQAMERNHDHG